MKQTIIHIIFLFWSLLMYSQNLHYEKLIDEGFSLLKKDSVEFALIKYSKAYKINPNGIKSNYGLGVCYSYFCVKDENFCDEAINYFMKVDQLSGNFRNTYKNLVSCYFIKSDYKNVIKYCNKILVKDVKNGMFYFYRGVAKIQIGEKDSGCSDLQESLNLDYQEAKNQIEIYCDD